MIELLTIEAMIKRPQHFRDLFNQCELYSVEPNDEMTFGNLVEIGLEKHREKIEEVSKKAEKQYNIERRKYMRRRRKL